MSEAVGIGLRRRSLVEAERLVVEFEQSGLTRRAFCVQHGLSAATLDKYRKRRRGSEPAAARVQAGTSRILPVEFVGNTKLAVGPVTRIRGGLCVELANGRRIEVADGFDAAMLERLLTVLEKA